MNGRIGLLSAVLLAQVLLVAVLWLQQRDGDADGDNTLLRFTANEITAIRITERDADRNEPLLLQRTADGWRSDGLPADGEKVQGLLDKLAALDSPWPVATTAVARERFEVTEDGFAKYLELLQDDEPVAALLLGTSPGFKRIHARRPGDDAVFSIALTSLDVPASANDWLDKSLLASAVDVDRIARLEHWEAVRSEVAAADPEAAAEAGSAWSLRALDTPAATEVRAADPAKVMALINRFKTLQVVGSVEGAAAEPVTTFELEASADDARQRYTLYHDGDADRFTMTRDDVAGQFEIAAYQAELLKADIDSLQAADAENPDTDAAESVAADASAEG